MSDEYKKRCDEVILPRAKSSAGVVFTGEMTDEQVLQALLALAGREEE